MPTNLSCFVPKIRRHRGVPTVYSTDDIETCLASIDRTTQSGKRTYAVLLICARLGLRNTDACELKFSDIDWDNLHCPDEDWHPTRTAALTRN